MKKRLFLLTAVILCGMAEMFATTTIYRVNPDATGTANGSTWEDAFTTLDAAIAARPAGIETAGGDTLEIWVKAGDYPTSVSNGYFMYQDINVYGGFAGTETAREQRDWETNVTTLKPSGAGKPIIQKYSLNAAAIRSAEWDGFTLTGVTGAAGAGGAVQLQRGCTLRNCTITGNISTSGQGIVFMYPGAVLENCVISNNSQTGAFSGVLVGHWTGTQPGSTSDHAKIINCVVVNNQSTGSGIVGCLAPYSVDIYNTLIANNTAKGAGGGIVIGSASGVTASTIINCTVVNNVSTDSEQSGISLLSNASGSSIVNTIVAGNNVKISANTVDISYTAVKDSLFAGTGNIKLTSNQFLNPTTTAGYLENLPAYDWSLLNTSAAINAGLNSAVLAGITDLAGNTRIQKETVDLGAYESSYEFISTALPTNPENQDVFAYAVENKIVIVTKTTIALPVQIYSLTGLKIIEQAIIGSTAINYQFSQGIYLVNVHGKLQKVLVK